MALTLETDKLVIGVVGSGAMGRGIAQIAAQGGYRVKLFDTNLDAIGAAVTSVTEQLDRLAKKGRLTREAADAAAARLEPVPQLAGLAACGLVVEAIVEDLAVKRRLFIELEGIVAPGALLASNTSSLSITAIGAACRDPRRVLGWHFFNPVPLMRVVEIVDGLGTDSAAGDALMELSRKLGHTPVRARDTPGFIVNHAGRGFGTEALRIVGESAASFADVDRVMREAAGFRLGPFELMDLTALDVSHPVMESIYHQYYEEARFRPSVITAQRLAGGWLGRKTGRGFYRYDDAATPVTEAAAPTELPRRVWVSGARPQCRQAVIGILPSAVELVANASDADLAVVTPLGLDATSCAVAEGLDASRVVALETVTPLTLRRTLMTTPATSERARLLGHALFAHDGVAVTVIRDSAGLIAQRILATIVNIACDIAQQGIASPHDIDLAVRLGLNYPNGPLAMGDALGAARILAVLENLQHFYGDQRYRPSPWLKRRALLGISLTQGDS